MTRRVLARDHHAYRDGGRKHKGPQPADSSREPLTWTVVGIANTAEGSE
jgi:hypothetical protein